MNRSMLLSCGCNHSSKYADKFCCPKDLWWSSAEIINVTEQKRKSSTKRPRKEYQTWLSYEYLMCHECLQWPQRCDSEKESSFENRSLEKWYYTIMCVKKSSTKRSKKRLLGFTSESDLPRRRHEFTEWRLLSFTWRIP